MQHVRRLLTAMLVFGVLAVLSLAPASASPRTATFQVNLTVPVTGAVALGALTISYDDDSRQGSWQFQGTLNGTLAQASGTGTYSPGAQSGLTLDINSIDMWNVPGVARVEGRSASLTFAGNLAYVTYHGPSYTVTGVPVAVSPNVISPPEGSYTLMNPATGEQPVTSLPNTGVAPASVHFAASSVAPLAILLLALVVTFAVMGLVGRRMLSSTAA